METTKLLASVRGEDKPKKKAPKKEAAGGETVRSSGYGATTSVRKRTKKRAASSTPRKGAKEEPPIVGGPDEEPRAPSFMKQLKQAMGTQTSAPPSVRSERSDEGAPPEKHATAGRGKKAPRRSQTAGSGTTTRTSTPATPDPNAARSAREADALTFPAQEAAIREGSDSYVPAIGIRLQALSNERQRLSIKEAAAPRTGRPHRPHEWKAEGQGWSCLICKQLWKPTTGAGAGATQSSRRRSRAGAAASGPFKSVAGWAAAYYFSSF